MDKREITIEPKVDSAQEFIEIALDFSNPLDLVREAISNAFDAKAKNITLDFSVVSEYGEKKQENQKTFKNIFQHYHFFAHK